MAESSDEPARKPVHAAILELVEVRGIGKTICPTEAAKVVSPANWRSVLPEVRAEAVRLAKAGTIAIYRKGRAVDPDGFKGVYRLGLPGKEATGPGGAT
ncbi:MAG: DUF3253 domain-containing protein [Pseudomonadota bacterium]